MYNVANILNKNLLLLQQWLPLSLSEIFFSTRGVSICSGNTKLDKLKQDLMVNVSLHDFYSRAKNYFPIDYPKYPAFQSRIKSAPPPEPDVGCTLQVKRSKSARFVSTTTISKTL